LISILRGTKLFNFKQDWYWIGQKWPISSSNWI